MKRSSIFIAIIALMISSTSLSAAGPNDGIWTVRRQVSGYDSLNIKEIRIDIGAKKTFGILHLADNHICFADSRDPEKKSLLARYRHREFPWANMMLSKELQYAQDNGLYIVHTGDLIDFISEMNLDYAAAIFSEGQWITSPGNHEFAGYMGYFGPEVEDDAHKMTSYEKVQEAFPDNFVISSHIINGVNFVSMDDTYYKITQEQWDLFRKEEEKGLPIVLLTHIPFYTPELYEKASEGGAKFSYLLGAPSECRDRTTLDFLEWLKTRPLLKAVLSSHIHFFHEGQFSTSAMQYVTGCGASGECQKIMFTARKAKH